MKPPLAKLNTALVHDWLTIMAGGEKTLLAIAEIFADAPIYTTVYDREKLKAFANRNILTSVFQNWPLVKKKRELLVPLSPFAFEQFDMGKYDLVISSSSMAAKGVITKPGTTHICYCHTPSRYLWEPQVDPRASGGAFSVIRKRISHHLRIWDRLAADRVDHFIANSRYVQQRIKKYYRRDSEVIYPPVDIEKFLKLDEKVGDYYLFASRLVDYKKCDLVIKAFNQLGLPLVVVGKGPDREKLQKMAKSNIKFLGFVSDEELQKTFAQAKAFVFPAEEDFGIVMVEALASGRPVIAYRAGGAMEILEEGINGEFFNEQNEESLVAKIKEFDADKYDKEEIRKTSHKFSKQIFQQKLIEFVESKVL